MDINIRRLETFLVFTLFIAIFAFIYPDLFFMRQSPMGGDPMTLKDPTVSWSAFIPAFREFRYELLEHGNLLWSNLRGMGQPILGNTVQGAPLFPLNLVLLPLPDQVYWTVMPISRIVLICLASFLISRKVIGLSLAASLMFALLIGFNTNTVRWMNHPWTNGLLAGLWYFYFLCRICLVPTPARTSLISAGLIVSVFAMVTSGFPEAAAMSAIIVGILFLGFTVTNWSVLKPQLNRIASLLVICHLIGFALSSIQIFALLEFIHVSGAMELRSGFAGGSYKPEDLWPYALAQLSIFGTNKEHQSLLTFSMGLWGLFFAIRGIIAILSGSLKRNHGTSYSAFAIACLVCMGIFVAKAFGLSEIINKIFLSTPILAESHFPLYFSPLFFIGFAFFAALGFSELLTSKAYSHRDQLISISASVISIAIVLSLSVMAIIHFHNMNVAEIWATLFSSSEFISLRFFAIASIAVTLFQVTKMTHLFRGAPLNKVAWSISLVILTLCVVETSNTVPKRFSPHGFVSLSVSEDTKRAIDDAYSAAPLPQHELRGTNLYGDFVGQGLATVDNGASAILTPEYRLLRRALFNVPYGGYLPLKGPYGSWSYDAMSANIRSVHATPKSNPSWQDYKAEQLINSQLTAWPSERLALENPLFFQGRSLAHVKEYHGVSIWLHFHPQVTNNQAENVLNDFWVEANIAGQTGIGISNDRHTIDTRWRISMPADWLVADTYKVTLRQIDTRTNNYHDTEPALLTLDRDHPDAVLGRRLQLLSSSSDNTRHFFFDKEALPRAYIAHSCDQADSIESEVDFYRHDDSAAKGQVIFPFDEPPTSVPCDNYSNSFKRVAITADKQNELSFQPIQGPALLVLNDSDYPGWKASERDSGDQLDILRANTNGRSIYLPEARIYNVDMSYTPIWLVWVYVLLVLAIVLIAWLYRIIWIKGNA